MSHAPPRQVLVARISPIKARWSAETIQVGAVVLSPHVARTKARWSADAARADQPRAREGRRALSLAVPE